VDRNVEGPAGFRCEIFDVMIGKEKVQMSHFPMILQHYCTNVYGSKSLIFPCECMDVYITTGLFHARHGDFHVPKFWIPIIVCCCHRMGACMELIIMKTCSFSVTVNSLANPLHQ